MAVHAYFLAILVAASVGGAADVPARVEPDLLISANHILADVNQLHVVLMTQETPGVERVIDVPKLKAQVAQRLRDAGITPLDRDTDTTHRLVVHIEGIEVPGSDKYVYRIQTALSRLVMVPGLGNRRLQTEVWRVRPVMEAVAGSDAGKAISAAVLVQVEAFVGAYKAARSVLNLTEDAAKDASAAGVSGPMQATAAESSVGGIVSVHCVEEQLRCSTGRTADGHRISPATISSATRPGKRPSQSGKRPCKSCKP